MSPGLDPAIVTSLRERGLMKDEVRQVRSLGGGCINEAMKVQTDTGEYFVKLNRGRGSGEADEAFEMFTGEAQSLSSIAKAVPGFAPFAYEVGRLQDGGAFIITDYLDLSSSSTSASYQKQLGERLATLHSHVEEQGRFGFPCPTYCGATRMENAWEKDWVTFLAEKRFRTLVRETSKREDDPELVALGDEICDKAIPFLFPEPVEASLLHGDLWSGNVGSTREGAVSFDASSFYGHSEWDLGITRMFGGFTNDFYQAYHAKRPKSEHYEAKQALYRGWNYLNHFYLFGGGYRSSTFRELKKVLQAVDEARRQRGAL